MFPITDFNQPIFLSFCLQNGMTISFLLNSIAPSSQLVSYPFITVIFWWLFTVDYNLNSNFSRYLQGRSGDTDVENGHVDMVGEGEGEINSESSTDTYTLPSVKYIASGELLYRPGSSTWCSVITQRSGMRGGVGRRSKMEATYVYIQLINFMVQQKLTQQHKAIIFQF